MRTNFFGISRLQRKWTDALQSLYRLLHRQWTVKNCCLLFTTMYYCERYNCSTQLTWEYQLLKLYPPMQWLELTFFDFGPFFMIVHTYLRIEEVIVDEISLIYIFRMWKPFKFFFNLCYLVFSLMNVLIYWHKIY